MTRPTPRPPARIRLVLDENRCSGLGFCEALSPDVFRVGRDGHLQLLLEHVDAARRDELEEACDACPTGALSVTAPEGDHSGGAPPEG